MVFGHTLDATLSDAARATSWVTSYWKLRTFTAPLFLFVSGCAVMWVVTRKQESGPRVLLRFLPRIGLLLALGYCVRLPIWDLRGWLGGDADLWRLFLTFDALQCIAASMACVLALCVVIRPDFARISVFSLLAVAFAFLAPTVWQSLGGSGKSLFWAQTLGGGDSRFSLFPWAAYFFSGAALGVLFARDSRVGLGLLAGLALVLAGHSWLSEGSGSGHVLLLTDDSPRKFVWRLGPVMVLFLAAFCLPRKVAQAIAPVGRASLWAYVLHLPICYGWGFWHGLATHVGKSLSVLEACGLGLVMVIFTALWAPALRHLYGLAPWKGLSLGLPRTKTIP